MRLYEWVVATRIADAWHESPVGISRDWKRAEAQMLKSLAEVRSDGPARGWVTVLALGADRLTYDRLETPVQVIREMGGKLRPAVGDLDGDRLRGRLEAQQWTTAIDSRRLRALRLERGMSQGSLADRAGVSVTTVARLERHPLPLCHFRTRSRLAKALGEHPYAITALVDPELAEEGADTV
jgi:DNA-binding XRE family transcriptional regulator